MKVHETTSLLSSRINDRNFHYYFRQSGFGVYNINKVQLPKSKRGREGGGETTDATTKEV